VRRSSTTCKLYAVQRLCLLQADVGKEISHWKLDMVAAHDALHAAVNKHAKVVEELWPLLQRTTVILSNTD